MKTQNLFAAFLAVLSTFTASAATVVEVRCWNPRYESEEKPRTRIDIRWYDEHARASLFDPNRFGTDPLGEWDAVQSTLVPGQDLIYVSGQNRYMLALTFNGVMPTEGSSVAKGHLRATYSYTYDVGHGDGSDTEVRSIDEQLDCKLLSK